MRLPAATLLLCAFTATFAFAQVPLKPSPNAQNSDAAKVDALKLNATEMDAAKTGGVKTEPPNTDTASMDAAATPTGSGGTVAPAAESAPVVVPTRPLSDTSRSAKERAQLSADDSDAALDKALGLTSTDDGSAEPDSMGLSALKTLIMMAIVVGLIYLTLNVGLRRMMGIKSGPLGGKVGLVNVVERIPLEQRRTLFVLKAAGEYLLVGTSEGGMTLISKLDTAEVERLQRERGSAQAQLSPFFQKLLSGQKKSGPPPQA